MNYILASNIANGHCGAYKVFFDKNYACPDLFAILFEEMSLIGAGTCRKNIIRFPGNDEHLTFTKGS